MRPSWASPRTATVGLVLANLVPLVGVVAFGWNLHSLLVGYWLESGVVGVAFVARIRRAEGEDDPDGLPRLSLSGTSVDDFVGMSNRRIAASFVGHYGTFWVAHGIFVFTLPGKYASVAPASWRVVVTALVGLAAYHAVSYRVTYLGEGEYAHTGPVTLMVEPYRRVFVLHLTVVLGGFAIGAAGTPAGAVAVMVLVKTVLDLWGHWREHDRARGRAPSSVRP